MKKIKVTEHSIERFFERILEIEPDTDKEKQRFIKNIILESLDNQAFKLGYGDFIIKDYNAVAIIRNFTVITIVKYVKKQIKKPNKDITRRHDIYLKNKKKYKFKD